MGERVHTIRPGELRAEEIVGTAHPLRPNAATEPVVYADPWIGRLTAVADHVMGQMPAGSGGGRTVAIAILYLLVVVHAAAFGAHLVGDGSVKAKAARTECLVEWLVERAVADDQGKPPPPFSPLSCRLE